MDLRPIVIMLLTISISGCATSRPKIVDQNPNGANSFIEIYQKSKDPGTIDILHNPGAALQMGAQMGYTKPYLPVFQEPKIIKVWIPPHKSKDDHNVLIAGHWSYVMVEDPSWYIDNEITKEMSVGVIVPSLPQKD
jgi:hypothetical protein